MGRTDESDSTVVGTVVGVLMFAILTTISVLGVVLLKVFFSKKHRKEHLRRVQQDILAM